MKFYLDDCVEGREESPPSRGAWIEMILVSLSVPLDAVAPLAGGVD